MKRPPSKSKASGKVGRPKGNSPPEVPLSPRRRWWFRLIALVVMPVLLLVVVGALLEVVLRLAGYGFDPAFFRSIRVDGRDYLLNNEDFTRRFFPAQLARWPDPFKMPAVKAPDTIRIFIFGESAAMGDPQPAYGASRYMEALLRGRFPRKKIEVINLGITAINSHVILPIARECAAQQGDFWIIYMGNNEMVGPFGAATVFGARALPRRVAQLNVAIQGTRVGQLLVAGLRHLGGKSQNTSWGGMEMFLQNQIAPSDPRKETVYQNFAGNLRDIVAVGVNSGAKVILSTISVNLKDCPPFASVGGQPLAVADRQRFEQVFEEAKRLQQQGDLAGAADQFGAAVKLEPDHAEAHFRLGQCELALSNAAAAGEFQAACDADALPFRADTRVNAIIRQAAQAGAGGQLVLADAERALAGAGAAHITGEETFFEHVHFNFDGNYRLGRLWAEQVAQSLAAAGTPPAGTNWAAQADCERALGLSIWNRQFVMQSVMRRLHAPPLSTQFNNLQRLERAQAGEFALRQQEAQPGAGQQVRADFADALKRAPEDSYLYEGAANFYEAVKDWPAAIAAYRRLLELRPDDFYACLQLGRLLGEQGRPAEGEVLLAQAARLRSSLPDAWFELGNVQSAQAKFTQALECMEHAARLRSQDSSYVCYAGQILSKLNRHAEAMDHYRRALQMDAGNWQAHFELAGELVAVNQPVEAMNEYTAVLKLNPRQVTSHINLGVLLVRFNRFEEAITCFQDALAIEPENRAAQEYLASVQAHKPGAAR